MKDVKERQSKERRSDWILYNGTGFAGQFVRGLEIQSNLRLTSMLFTVVILVAMFPSSASAQTGSLSGRILRHSNGSPLANVYVYIYQGNDPAIADDDAWNWVASGYANSNGEYRFENLAPRKYRVHVYEREWAGAHYLEADLFNVQVLAGTEAQDEDIHLRQAGLIYGYVKTPSGVPVPNAQVVSEVPWTQNGNSWHQTSTDSNGRYELWLPPSPGQFYPVVVFEASLNEVTYTSQWDGQLHQATLNGTQVPDYTMQPGGTVTGRVVNESGIGISDVYVHVRINAVRTGTNTDSDGHFSLSGLAPGLNYVEMEPEWQEIQRAGVKYASGETVKAVTVAAGQTVGIGNFVLYEAGMITGVITDQSSQPIEGVEVNLDGRDINGNYAYLEGVTDALGQYALDYVSPGLFILSTEKEGYISANVREVPVGKGQQVEQDVVMTSSSQGVIMSGVITNYVTIAPRDSQGVLLPQYERGDYDDYGYPYFGIDALSMGHTFTEQDFLDIGDHFFVGGAENEDIEDGYGDYFEPDPSETVGHYQTTLPPGEVGLFVYHEYESNDRWSVTLHDWKHYSLVAGDVRSNVDFTVDTGSSGVLKGNVNVPAGYTQFPEDWCIIVSVQMNHQDFSGSEIGHWAIIDVTVTSLTHIGNNAASL